jgi:hypothetical protein
MTFLFVRGVRGSHTYLDQVTADSLNEAFSRYIARWDPDVRIADDGVVTMKS